MYGRRCAEYVIIIHDGRKEHNLRDVLWYYYRRVVGGGTQYGVQGWSQDRVVAHM